MEINKKKFKNLFICMGTFIAILICVTGFRVMSDKELKEAYKNDWAIFNYGQEIDGEIGKKGLDVNVLAAWEITKGCKDVIVAVVDTGVDSSCEVFCDNTILQGYDFYNYDETTYDEYIYDYHGTYVCSTIANIAPNISIIPIKFMESTTGSIEDAISGIEYAIANGADIINCSWNFYDYNEELYKIIKDNPSILFVCAAGNYSANLDEVQIYPCAYELDNVINTMAIDNSGNRYSTSGYGINSVDIAAPGKNVKVWLPENDTAFIDGTSVATAFITATAALMLSENKCLSPVELKLLMLESASKISSLETLCKSGGCVNIYKAIEKCGR